MKKIKDILLNLLFFIFFILVPIMPDVQITRPKLFTIEILSYLMFVVFVFWVLLVNKINYYKSKVILFFIIFFIYVLVRYIISNEKPIMFNEIKRWLLSIWLFYIISVASYKKQKVFINFFIFGSFLATLYGLLQHFGGIAGFIDVPKMERVMSMFGNPIFFAVHIINFLPIVFGLFLVEKKFFLKIIYFMVFLVALITLYYTKTRAAFIALFLSSIFFIYFLYPSRKKFLYLASFVVLFFLFLIFTKNIWLRHQAHPLIWRDTIKMWLSNPIFGVGIGKFHIEFVKFASEDLRKIWPQKNFIINDAHNEYLQMLSESGIIGFVLFVLPILIFFYENLKKLNIQKDFLKRVLIISLLSGCFAVLVQNFFSVDMRFIISSVYMFITMGITLSINNEMKEKKLIFVSRELKIVSFLAFFVISGLVSFSNKTVSLLSILHISSKGVILSIDDNGFGLLQIVLRPYLANYKLSKEKDFFDEKIVNAAETLQELQKLKEKYPDKAIIYEKIAWIYAKERQFDKAIQNYLKAIELNPDSYAAYNNLGNIMFYIDRKKAIEYYLKSIEINPRQVDARLNLGITYYLEGKLDLASEQFNEVLKIDPKNEKAIVYLKKMRE